MSAGEMDPELIELSRQRLAIPADWEWFACANACGDVVWCPPDLGDLGGVEPVCSVKCARQLMVKR